MLNREKHQLLMGRILRDIYADAIIASLLGFKGGTCAYFFYDLPRFSVDLDFDLLKTCDEAAQKQVFESVGKILEQYGEIKDRQIKRFAVFFLLSYGDTDHNIKIEINVRQLMPDMKIYYELKEYLGISMFVAKKDYLFASKLSALTLRTETAMRDIYDVWYFAKQNCEIDAAVIEARTHKKTKEYLNDCIATIEEAKDNQILQELGELLNDKEKTWVKNHLRSEAVFLLKNYQSILT